MFSVTASAVPIKLPIQIPPIVPPSSSSSSESEPSLKKLLKDLHRCDVSLLRYQSSLNEVNTIYKDYTTTIILIFSTAMRHCHSESPKGFYNYSYWTEYS